jgi:hypothetical protein
LAELETLLNPSLSGNVSPAEFGETGSAYSPAIGHGVGPAEFGETGSVYGPRVGHGVSPAELTEGESLYGPRVGHGVSPAELTEGESLYGPRVGHGVSPAELTEGESLYAPTLLGASGGAPYTFVEAQGADSGVASDAHVVLTNAVLAGDVIIIAIAVANSLAPAPTVTDPASNTYTAFLTGPSVTLPTSQTWMYGCLNAAAFAASGTVSVSFGVTLYKASICVYHYRPANVGVAVVDQSNARSQNSTTPATASVTTTPSNELYLAFLGMGAGTVVTITPPGTWTNRYTVSPTSAALGLSALSMGDGGGTVGGTYSAAWGMTVAHNCGVFILTLQ